MTKDVAHQNQLDKTQQKELALQIYQATDEKGKKEDAETAKARVAEIKETNKALQAEMDKTGKT